MSAHGLLNLLNKLGKRDKMLGLPGILSLFLNKINKINNTGARILDSIYHMTLRLHQSLWSAVAQWLFDSRPEGHGFYPHWHHCIVVLEQDTFILA